MARQSQLRGEQVLVETSPGLREGWTGGPQGRTPGSPRRSLPLAALVDMGNVQDTGTEPTEDVGQRCSRPKSSQEPRR